MNRLNINSICLNWVLMVNYGQLSINRKYLSVICQKSAKPLCDFAPIAYTIFCHCKLLWKSAWRLFAIILFLNYLYEMIWYMCNCATWIRLNSFFINHTFDVISNYNEWRQALHNLKQRQTTISLLHFFIATRSKVILLILHSGRLS